MEGIKDKCKVSEHELMDCYDEETVLQQVPQDDTRVAEVVKKFKNQNKVVDTTVRSTTKHEQKARKSIRVSGKSI